MAAQKWPQYVRGIWVSGQAGQHLVHLQARFLQCVLSLGTSFMHASHGQTVSALVNTQDTLSTFNYGIRGNCSKDKMWLNFLLKGGFAKNSSWLVTSHQKPALEFRTSCFYSCKAWDGVCLSLLILLKVLSKNSTSKTPWINETQRLKLCICTIHLNDKKQK